MENSLEIPHEVRYTVNGVEKKTEVQANNVMDAQSKILKAELGTEDNPNEVDILDVRAVRRED